MSLYIQSSYNPRMIDVAIDAAKKGGDLAYRYFKTQPKVTYKPDNSPVTKADIETEKLIRKIISKKFPEHGFIGEESGKNKESTKYVWVVDPIDGTKQFIRGIPFWTTLVALLENGKPILGIAYSPVTDELFTAQKGKGTYLNGKRVHVSKISDLRYAYLSYSSITPFQDKNKIEGFLKICGSVHSQRGYGDTLGYMLLMQGKTDIMLEAKDDIYDIATPSILIEEAGGKFTDFSGKFSITSGNAVATNGILHDQVLKILNAK